MKNKKSLLETHPKIAAEWHPTKNGYLTPDQIVAGSNKKVMWKCPKGPDHEWPAIITERTGKKRKGCPCCAGRKVSVTNSLATLLPELAAEWHPTKNGDLTPDQIVAGSRKKSVGSVPRVLTTNGRQHLIIAQVSKVVVHIAMAKRFL